MGARTAGIASATAIVAIITPTTISEQAGSTVSCPVTCLPAVEANIIRPRAYSTRSLTKLADEALWLLDPERVSMKFHAVGSIDSSVSIFLSFEKDESIIALHDNISHFSVLPIQILQMVLFNAVAYVSNVDLCGSPVELLIAALAAFVPSTVGIVGARMLPPLFIVLVVALGVVRLLVPAGIKPAFLMLRILTLFIEFVTLLVGRVIRGLLVMLNGITFVSRLNLFTYLLANSVVCSIEGRLSG